MTDYVKYYKEITNKDFDSNKYQVHHIDLNRNNNDISNLVMLPKELHTKYHIIEQELRGVNFVPDLRIKSVIDMGNGYNSFLEYKLSILNKILKECNRWNDYKNYLLGLIPNIHDMEVN